MSESKTNISPAKKGRNRKKGVIAIVLVMALVIGGTLAYLGTRSNDAENIFTGSKDIDLTLTEPKWKDKKTNEKDSEETRAKEYTPGGVYLKNPKLYNSSEDTNATEWVAIKVSFKLEDLSQDSDGTSRDDNVKGTDLLKPLADQSKISMIDATWEEIGELINIQIVNTGSDKGTVPYKTGFSADWNLICTSKDLDTTGKLPANFTYGTKASIENDATWAIFVYKKTISNNTDKANITSANKDTFDNWAADNNGVTTSLFDRIQVLTQDTIIGHGYKKENPNQSAQESYPKVNVYLPKFEIKLEGAAIKNEIRERIRI